MDKFTIALLGEAGATGFAKGICKVFKDEEFHRSYENELNHWKYFKKYKRSRIDYVIYIILYIFGILVSIFGKSAVGFVLERIERTAIEFYIKNFPMNEEIAKIIEDEETHLMLAVKLRSSTFK
jgi:hypothetical protein